MTEQLLRLERVAEILDKPMSYVYELTAPATRRLPVVYVGPRSPRVRLSDLSAFIESRTSGPKEEQQ